MGVAEKIYKYSLDLPDEQAKQLLAFAQFLQQNNSENSAFKKRKAGMAKHTIKIIDKEWYKPDVDIENDFYQ